VTASKAHLYRKEALRRRGGGECSTTQSLKSCSVSVISPCLRRRPGTSAFRKTGLFGIGGGGHSPLAMRRRVSLYRFQESGVKGRVNAMKNRGSGTNPEFGVVWA